MSILISYLVILCFTQQMILTIAPSYYYAKTISYLYLISSLLFDFQDTHSSTKLVYFTVIASYLMPCTNSNFKLILTPTITFITDDGFVTLSAFNHIITSRLYIFFILFTFILLSFLTIFTFTSHRMTSTNIVKFMIYLLFT